jgi:DNA-directed RNA polymerase subunit RPC12/RpoP
MRRLDGGTILEMEQFRHDFRNMTKLPLKRRKKRTPKCTYCGQKIAYKGNGRPPRYCSASHRQRAYELRKLKVVQTPLAALMEDIARAKLRDIVRLTVNEAMRLNGIAPAPAPKREKPKHNLQLVVSPPKDGVTT